MLVRRMQPFGTTVFAEMTALAQATGAVNLGQGFPDTDGPASMLAAAQQAIGAGLNQYPPGRGLPQLRAVIGEQRGYDQDTEVLVTVGATEGITAALLAVCEPGDEVIVLEPAYDSYPAAIALAGALPRPVPLRPESPAGRFGLDPAELRAAVGPRTRAIVVNSPHNPTGTVLTPEELGEIAALCVERELLAITDEVYEHLVFDGASHARLASLPGMRERTVAVSSAGKTFSVTGWKIGWVCAPAELVTAVNTVKQFLTFTHSGPFQAAVAYALTCEADWVEELRESLQDRRDRLTAGLRDAGLGVHVAQGTYFLQADVRPLGYDDGVEFCRMLPHKAGVVAIPTRVFCTDPAPVASLVRFTFCKRDEVLDEAVRRLGEHLRA